MEDIKEILPSEQVVEEVVEEVKPKTKKVEKLDVILFALDTYKFDGVEHYFVVTTTGKLRGFFVPTTELEYNSSLVQKIAPDTYPEVYNWESEIEEMLPSIEELKRNILRSFWKAGAYTNDPNPNVKRNMLRTAFPYRMPLKEK